MLMVRCWCLLLRFCLLLRVSLLGWLLVRMFVLVGWGVVCWVKRLLSLVSWGGLRRVAWVGRCCGWVLVFRMQWLLLRMPIRGWRRFRSGCWLVVRLLSGVCDGWVLD